MPEDKRAEANAANASSNERKKLLGVAAALAAYVIWGSSVIFYKALGHVPADEIIAHRIFWSLVFTALYLAFRGKLRGAFTALKHRKTVLTLLLTSGLVALNWLVFVWAITHNHVVEAALGYFILPLFSVVLGFFVLGEQLNRAQTISVLLAAIAVTTFALELGVLPLIPLTLAVSFGLYGFFRKRVEIGPSQGLFIEVLLLGLPAIGYLVYLHLSVQAHFFTGAETMLLLILSGPLTTALPLIFYAEAVKQLRLVTVGLIFYVNPTIQFLIGVLIYREPFSALKLLTFMVIWFALALYIHDAIRTDRRRRKSA